MYMNDKRRAQISNLGKLSANWSTKHGDYKSVEWYAWYSMRQRCYNSNHSDYKSYGGRGIGVYSPWRSKKYGAKRFLNWIDSPEGIGRRPSSKHSIDRYPDNDGNYEPGNLRWATAKQQARNRRPYKKRRISLAAYYKTQEYLDFPARN